MQETEMFQLINTWYGCSAWDKTLRSTPKDEGMWLRETMVGEEILWWGNSYQSYHAVWRGDWRQDMNSVGQASKVEGWFTSQDTSQQTKRNKL